MAAEEPTPEAHMAHIGLMPFAIEPVILNMDDGTRIKIEICSECKIMGASCLHGKTERLGDEIVCSFCGLDRT